VRRRIKRAVDELNKKALDAKSLQGVDSKAVEELGRYAANAQKAYEGLMTSIEKALDDPKAFQNIFKRFFRVEIRVPAYINLTEIKEFSCIVKTNKPTKQFTQIQFKEFETPLLQGMECSIVHKILVECRTCVMLLQRFKQNKLNALAVPLLQAADSDEVAQAFRNDAARRYEMKPPSVSTCCRPGRCSLAGDLCHRVLGGSIAGELGHAQGGRHTESCPR
jgi:hypothetical protein